MLVIFINAQGRTSRSQILRVVMCTQTTTHAAEELLLVTVLM